MYKFIDLFCGIGGFRIALEEKGMECVFSSDIDKDVQETYKRNFGEKPMGDISEISERKIPKHDILCAGFPCQPFSISGKQNGLHDINGKLFYEIIRIAQYHKPLILLLENVKNIMNNKNAYIGKNIETIFKNSIIDYADVVKKIQNIFAIDSRLVTTINEKL